MRNDKQHQFLEQKYTGKITDLNIKLGRLREINASYISQLDEKDVTIRRLKNKVAQLENEIEKIIRLSPIQ